ncbi:MAG TPA: hypothetical protein VFB06_11195 [Streptosporangiaceae bacterium]|nr:hypothetical protein [Streptosporangiaceae bacterium]
MRYVIEHGGWDPRPGWSEDDPTPEKAVRALASMRDPAEGTIEENFRRWAEGRGEWPA